MIFLIISVPLSVLCAYLAWLAFRVRHGRIAVGLLVVSLLAALFSAGVLGGFHYLFSHLQMQ